MGLRDKQKFLSGTDGEEKNLFTKLYDRAMRSEKFGGAMFGDFLNMEEQSRFMEREKFLPEVEPVLFGGYEDAERKMVGFNAQEEEFPIVCIEFAVRTGGLTHRDYLGSLMGLGIERCKIGDIVVLENGALVVAHKDIGDYAASSLLTVGRANVTSAREVPLIRLSSGEKKFTDVIGTVASLRLDSITAMLSGKGRNVACELIKAGRVFVNGINVLKADVKINNGDTITVRGFGKAVAEIGGRSKKDRIFVTLKKYS